MSSSLRNIALAATVAVGASVPLHTTKNATKSSTSSSSFVPKNKHGLSSNIWVTRERPKIDRIACPWLIKRFVDPKAQFLYVPTKEVLETADRVGGIPYDVDGVEYSHEGDNCTFDTMIKKFNLDEDPALKELAVIVRGADTNKLDLAPQCHGLLAVSLGLSKLYQDDHEQLTQGMIVYDALYAWLKDAKGEKHTWEGKAKM